jgi:hypothetical protein
MGKEITTGGLKQLINDPDNRWEALRVMFPNFVSHDGTESEITTKQMHNLEDLPTKVLNDGTQVWLDTLGQLHRDNDQAAVIRANGIEEWYQHGKRHRENDQPAIRYLNGTKEWFVNGNRHRDKDQPAVIRANGTQKWYQHGLLHRDNDKPAVVWADGSEYYYKNGDRYKPDVSKTATEAPVNRYFTNSNYLRFLSPHCFRENGSLKSFAEQLRELNQYRSDEHLILSGRSKDLSIPHGTDKPLVISKGKIDQINKTHPEVIPFLPYFDELIKQAPLMVESWNRNNSLVVMLNSVFLKNGAVPETSNLTITFPILFNQAFDSIDTDKMISTFNKKEFEEFLAVSVMANKNIFINENFTKWSGRLPSQPSEILDQPRQCYFNLGLTENKEKLQIASVFIDKPSTTWRRTQFKLHAPDGFRWVTNGKRTAMELTDKSLKFDSEALYCEMFKNSTTKQSLNSQYQLNLPPKAIKLLAQHEDQAVREKLAKIPAIKKDIHTTFFKGMPATITPDVDNASDLEDELMSVEEEFAESYAYAI